MKHSNCASTTCGKKKGLIWDLVTVWNQCRLNAKAR